MAKRLFVSCFFAVVVCGLSFYLAYFGGLMYAAATAPLHPANDPGLEWTLRYIALPVSLALGAITFVFSFRRFANK